MTTSDVVISDVVIVATSESTSHPSSSSSTVVTSCVANKEPVQLKLKVDEHGLGLSREQLSSDVSGNLL